MRVERVIHPVGQGAFYTERFVISKGVKNIVFDCGGDKTPIRDCIDAYINYLASFGINVHGKPIIDAVFISHFDEDHICGLEKLFAKSFVKKLFLPLINDNEVHAISESFLNMLGSSFYRQVLNSAITGASIEGFDETKIIRMRPSSDDGTHSNREREEYREDDYLRLEDAEGILNSGSCLYIDFAESNTTFLPIQSSTCSKKLWIFKTFNYDNDQGQRTDILKRELAAENIHFSLAEIIRHLFDTNPWNNSNKTFKEIVQDAYKKAGKKKGGNSVINDNSLVTYSGPIDESIKCYCRLISLDGIERFCLWDCPFWPRYFEEKAGCMYMGDYDAADRARDHSKYDQYEKYFKNQIKLLHMLQVPHHGSAVNYNAKLNNPPKISFISAGLHNRYKHPSGSVLKDMSQNNVPWIWIHEYFGPIVIEYEVC